MSQFERAGTIAAFLRSKISEIPDTAVVLGSGLGAFGEAIERVAEIKYEDIPGFPISTVPGHAGKLIFGYVEGKYVVAMQGRFHRYEGYDMNDVTLYVCVFSLLGIKNLILTNAAGAINRSFHPGDLMLINDHISLFCESPLFGKNEEEFGERFFPMNYAYNPDLQQLALAASAECGVPLQQGVYCYTKGPMFETPAEIRALRTLGADACGMSTVPEVIVANHCGLRVLGISCMTNMAAGILKEPLSHKEVLETGKAVEQKFKLLLNTICRKLI